MSKDLQTINSKMWYNICIRFRQKMHMEKTTESIKNGIGTVTISKDEYEKLLVRSERLDYMEHRLNSSWVALRLSLQKQFGASSEKMTDKVGKQLILLFDEAEKYADAEAEAEVVRALEIVSAWIICQRTSLLNRCLPDLRKGRY